MDRIESMGVFAKVVAKQSFSGAARELRLSQAVVSKHVRALEDWLGAQLLNRTTRRLNVTEIGALVYERCERILDEIDEVQQSTSALQTAPRGVRQGRGCLCRQHRHVCPGRNATGPA
jgi:DNA-binding transcriptional LysR family regulator